jgi:hypothetical protein
MIEKGFDMSLVVEWNAREAARGDLLVLNALEDLRSTRQAEAKTFIVDSDRIVDSIVASIYTSKKTGHYRRQEAKSQYLCKKRFCQFFAFYVDLLGNKTRI